MNDDADETVQQVDELLRRITDPVKWEQQQKTIACLETPVGETLARLAGIDTSSITDLIAQSRERAARLIAASVFGSFGWTISDNLKDSDIDEALRLWESSHDEAAVDECLTRAWADGPWLRRSYGPLISLAGRHEPTRDLLLARNALLDKALDHHEAREYEASVLIVLTQVDGMTFDFTDNAFGFFYHAEDEYFEDEETVAGMPMFLRVVRRAVNRAYKHRAVLSAEFRRHPMMHGRYLGFGTETNSTKAFALIAGVIDWLTPKAKALTDRLQDEHEARWAGSLERDAEGRRMDRRGFIETRDGLRWLAIRQTSEHRQHGRYNADLLAMFPAEGIGRMQRRNWTSLVVAPDGQTWWAWCPTDTTLIFGIAGRDGAVESYYYAGDEPPGAVGEDDRWVHEFDDRPPDWMGE